MENDLFIVMSANERIPWISPPGRHQAARFSQGEASMTGEAPCDLEKNAVHTRRVLVAFRDARSRPAAKQYARQTKKEKKKMRTSIFVDQ